MTVDSAETKMARNSHLYPSPQPRQSGSGGAGQWLVFILVGGLSGFYFSHFGIPSNFESALLDWFVMLLMVVLAIWVQTLIHEVGHVVAGYLVGKRLIAGGMGPLRLVRMAEGWRLQWVGSVQGIGGFAAMYTPHDQIEKRRHNAVFILGGPAANLIAAGLSLMALLVISPEATLLRQLLDWLLIIGLVFALVNLMPFKVGGWSTDGRTLLNLLREDATLPTQLKLSQLLALGMAGVRPRDWPADLIPASPTESTPEELRMASHLFRMELALDTGDRALSEQCAAELAANLWDSPDGQRQGIAVLMALHAAWFLEDRDLLEAWLTHIQGGLVRQDCALAVLQAESGRLAGDRDTMLEALRRAEAALQTVLDEASRQQFRERITDLTGTADLDEVRPGH